MLCQFTYFYRFTPALRFVDLNEVYCVIEHIVYYCHVAIIGKTVKAY